MKQLLEILTLFGILALSFSCAAQTSAKIKESDACKNLTKVGSEKILGQPVKLVEATTETKDNLQILKCKYSAFAKDKASGSEINLFFMLEKSSDTKQAKQIYKKIWDSNKNHHGIEVLNGIGDEAYAHSDSPNFHFVMTRKGNFTIRLKVNKAVESTSLDELKAFAKRIVAEI